MEINNMQDAAGSAITLCTRGDTANKKCPLKVDQNGGLSSAYFGEGTTIIYRCSVAGALRAGQLTSVSSDCGTAVDTGMRTP